MSWIEIICHTKSALAEKIAALLTELGALAITTQDAGDQPIYEPDKDTVLWEELRITGLFSSDCNIESAQLALKQEFPGLHFSTNKLHDCDWEKVWMIDFPAMQFGDRLWVIPSHLAQTPSPHHVILDPGLAFGTGKHPTTALCLEWLDKNIKQQQLIIDYGCGSGILAIAAHKLGAKYVLAIDNDEQALTATRDNAKKNGISMEAIITSLPNTPVISPNSAELIIANILANPLIELVTTFDQLLAPRGQLVLSGILQEQIAAIQAAYSPKFVLDEIEQREEWVRLSGHKRTIS